MDDSEDNDSEVYMDDSEDNVIVRARCVDKDTKSCNVRVCECLFVI